MKNNLLDLIKNLNTVLDVRSELLAGGAKKYHDVDEESMGVWLLLPTKADPEASNYKLAVGIYAKAGENPMITVNLNSLAFYKKLKGTPSAEEVIDAIYEGAEELGHELDFKE